MNLDEIPNDDFNYIVNNEEKALFESLKTFKMFDLVSDLENELTQAKDRIERLEGLVQSLSNKCNFFENHFDYLKSVTNETTHCEHEQIIQTQLSNSTHVHIRSHAAESPQQHQEVIVKKEESPITESSHEKELQKIFNKRVVYEVKRNFGKNYLADHQVRDLDSVKMLQIRETISKMFCTLPINRAWNSAMNGLRQYRHQLKKKRRYNDKTKMRSDIKEEAKDA